MQKQNRKLSKRKHQIHLPYAYTRYNQRRVNFNCLWYNILVLAKVRTITLHCILLPKTICSLISELLEENNLDVLRMKSLKQTEDLLLKQIASFYWRSKNVSHVKSKAVNVRITMFLLLTFNQGRPMLVLLASEICTYWTLIHGKQSSS